MAEVGTEIRVGDLKKGKRYLLKHSGSSVLEYKVLEISPSGNYVKLAYQSCSIPNEKGNEVWDPILDYRFLEELK